jgi:hypothetical protein
MSDLRSRLICGGKVRSSRHLSRFGAPSIESNFVIVRTRLYAALLDILSGTPKQTEAAVLYDVAEHRREGAGGPRFRDLCILNSKNDVTGLETRHVGNATIYHRSNNNFAGIFVPSSSPTSFSEVRRGPGNCPGMIVGSEVSGIKTETLISLPPRSNERLFVSVAERTTARFGCDVSVIV